MEASQQKPFNRRKFVSVGLFLTLIMLVISGIMIQIYEHLEEGFAIHFFTAAHVLCGLAFTVLSVLHTITNWRSLASYIKNKTAAGIGKETVVAVLMVVVIGLIGLLVGHFHG